MKILFAKITGTPDSTSWTQLHDFVPKNSEQLATRGHFFVMLSLIFDGVTDKDAATAGKSSLEELGNLYFMPNTSTFENLKSSVGKVAADLEGKNIKPSIAAAAVIDETIYVARYGEAEISLVRIGNFTPILSKGIGLLGASGKVKEGDVLMLGSSAANSIEHFSQNQIMRLTPEEIIESKTPEMLSSPNQSAVGLGVIKFEKETQTQVEESIGEDVIDQKNVEKSVVSPQETAVHEPENKPPEVDEEHVVEDQTNVNDQASEESEVEANEPVKKQGLLGKLKVFSPTAFRRDHLGVRRNLYINSPEANVEEVQKRKTAVTVAGVLLVLLVLSIGFGMRQQHLKAEGRDFEEKVAQVKHNIEEATALFILNPIRSRELFEKAGETLNILEMENKNKDVVAELRKSLVSQQTSVLGEFDTAAQELVDLSLIDGVDASKMTSDGETLYVFDKGKRRIIEVKIDTKKTRVVVGPNQLAGVRELTDYAGRIFVLEDDGIYEVGGSRSEVLKKDWGGDILIQTYSGNLYILEKETSKILRHSGTSTGFGTGSSWLAPGISPDLTDAVSWTIDGMVWILESNGSVSKYGFGSPKELEELKVAPTLARPTEIYTNENLDNFYILDPASSRVVVFDKDGKYKAQYKSKVFEDALGLVANEEQGKIIVLSKNKIFAVEMGN